MTDPAPSETADPLMRHVSLDHVVELPVIGVPVTFRTNRAAILDAVNESYGMWSALSAWPTLIGAGGVTVTIIEHEDPRFTADAESADSEFRFRMPDHERVITHTRGSVGIVDTRRGDAFAYVTPRLVADRERFRRAIVEGMSLTLATVRDRLPIHGALIARDGVALVLSAPSGTGKSTLAYQASRDGWTLLGDDATYVQTTPAVRYWGVPRHVLLSADAPSIFAELSDRRATPQPGGKSKIAIDRTHDWKKLGPPCVDDVAVVLLERGTGTARLEPVSATDLETALRNELAPVRDLYGDLPGRALPVVCARGGWRLSLTSRPADAAPLLEEIANRIRSGH